MSRPDAETPTLPLVDGRLATLAEVGALSPLDVGFARLLGRLQPSAPAEIALAGALASAALARGDTGVDLATVVEEVPHEPIPEAERSPEHDPSAPAPQRPVPGWRWPDPGRWVDLVRASPLASADPADRTPLVIRDRRVTLHRYDVAEQTLAQQLVDRALAPVPEVDAETLDALLPGLFPGSWANPEQEAAVRKATTGGLTVLAGGPGTGKTTTVVRILVALIAGALHRGEPPPRALLLAPTGKAAARLAESVARQKAALSDPDSPFTVDPAVVEALPESASTVHRALRPLDDWLTRFVHGAERPWAHEVVVVDEVSMVDLPLMNRLVAAVRRGARLVLIGDPDQLASVGPGAVLADLVTLASQAGATSADGVAGRVARLTESRRFAGEGGIGQLARAIDSGTAQALKAVWEAGHPQAVHLPPQGRRPDTDPRLIEAAVEGWRPFAEAEGLRARLDALDRFRVLTAMRVGPAGSEALNEAIERALARRGLLTPQRHAWYEGQPILIRSNDYRLRLFNGDTGVIARVDGTLMAVFEDPEAEAGHRAVLPARLPQHETVFAMTIHKSQGSEFDEVLIALPRHDHRLLSRNLLYTGVTRAKRQVRVSAPHEVLAATVARREARVSGLVAAVQRAERAAASASDDG